jgi:heptaprenyl diphosphate synthase
MSPLEQFRIARQECYEKLFSGSALCAAGLCVMPALLFNPSPVFRIFQFLFFWFLAWLAGKKSNPLITGLIILGILIFNLLVPYGRVLFSLGPFPITQGALMAGIQRAFTLEALIMLSRFSIRADLRLPGAFGELLGDSFRYFALITERKGLIKGGNIAAGIDALLIELSGEEAEPAGAETAGETAEPAGAEQCMAKTKPAVRPAGIVLLAAIVLLAWAPLIFQIFSGTR